MRAFWGKVEAIGPSAGTSGMEDGEPAVTAGTDALAGAGRRGARSRAVIGGAVVALVVVALAGGWWSRRASDPDRSGRRVLVIGDSLVRLGRDEITAAFEADGWRPTVRGFNRRTIAQVGDETAALRHRPWDAVVLWAGHNDALQRLAWSPGSQAVLDWVAGQRCGAVMEITEGYPLDAVERAGPTGLSGDVAGDINRRFRRLADDFPNVRLVPWAAVAAARPREVLSIQDMLHTSPAGRRLAAERMVAAVDSCRPRARPAGS